MKFGKLLQSWAATEANPAHGELFLRFKELKKTLKLIKPLEADADGQELVLDSAEPALDASSSREPTQAQQQGPTQPDSPEAMAEERTFLQTLREDLDRFNEFFIDKEEDFIIRIRSLEDRMDSTSEKKSLQQIRKAFTDLHGEMVLLLHWSLLNYTAVVKILKKHDKRSGVLLKQPLLASVLRQPFSSTDRITKLVKEAEEKLKALLEIDEAGGTESTAEDSMQSMREQQAELSKRTQAALDIWEEMQATASTPSTLVAAGAPQKRKAGEREGTDGDDEVQHKVQKRAQ